MSNDENRAMNKIRRQRAQAALKDQSWSFKQQGHRWSLATPTGRYVLHSTGAGSWRCSCEDYRRYQAQGVLCKHVHALTLLEEGEIAQEGQHAVAPQISSNRPTTVDAKGSNERPDASGTSRYAQIKQRLEVPFGTDELRFKPQYLPKQANGQPKAQGKCRVVAYADLRAYIARLDAAAPGGWQDQVQSVLTTESKVVVCVRLSILEISHSNLGEALLTKENAATIAYAQAFKRACADHGLGSYLYRLPELWVPYALKGKRQADLLETPRLPSWAYPAQPAPSGTANGAGDRRLRMDLDQARRTACPVQTADFPDIQGRPLGDLQQSHPQAERILSYLASEGFLRQANSPQRSQAHLAARLLLDQAGSLRPATSAISPSAQER